MPTASWPDEYVVVFWRVFLAGVTLIAVSYFAFLPCLSRDGSGLIVSTSASDRAERLILFSHSEVTLNMLMMEVLNPAHSFMVHQNSSGMCV